MEKNKPNKERNRDTEVKRKRDINGHKQWHKKCIIIHRTDEEKER